MQTEPAAHPCNGAATRQTRARHNRNRIDINAARTTEDALWFVMVHLIPFIVPPPYLCSFVFICVSQFLRRSTKRFLLCHLAANAVEERYGLSAFELAGSTGPQERR